MVVFICECLFYWGIFDASTFTSRQIILGVYRPLFFAKTQDDYDEAIELLYSGLDRVRHSLYEHIKPYLYKSVNSCLSIHLSVHFEPSPESEKRPTAGGFL